MFGRSLAPAVEVEDLNSAPNTNPRKPALVGLWITLLGFGGFMLWAFLAPLDQGVPGAGTVRVAGEAKVVQALTGGAIEKIFVKEGDLVQKNQVLVRLDKTQAESQLNILLGQWSSARAIQVRLRAEQAGLEKIIWPDDLLAQQHDPRVQPAIELQNQQFRTRQLEYQSANEIFKRNLDGLQEQLTGYKAIKQSHLEQIKFQNEELNGLRDLAKEGYVARNRLYDAERSSAQLKSQLAEDIANIGRTNQSIAETRLKALQYQQAFRRDVEEKLAEYTREVNGLRDRLKSAQFEMLHTQIKAPSSGQVVDLNTHTEGGVLQAGQKLMDIVPVGVPLIVEAKFSPLVIDKLVPGLVVDLAFSSLQRSDIPHLEGVVRVVSADQIVDPATKESYFLAQIDVVPESIKIIARDKLPIRPGLPVDVVVKTGERSMMSYLMKPIGTRIFSSFKEE